MSLHARYCPQKVVLTTFLQRALLLAALVASALYLSAQSQHYADMSVMAGGLIPHKESLKPLVRLPVQTYGLDLRYSRRTTSNNKYDIFYRHPYTGVGLQFVDLGYKNVLGQAYTIYIHWDCSLVGTKKSELDYSLHLGFSYLTKTHNKTENPLNVAISQHINVFVQMGFAYKYRLSGKYALFTKVVLTHYSNGAATLPNRGLNQFNVSLGMETMLMERESRKPAVERLQRRGFDISMMATMGKNGRLHIGETQLPLRKTACNVVSVAVAYRYGYLGSVSLSADCIIDQTNRYRWSDKHNDFVINNEMPFADYTCFALCIGHELMYKNMGLFAGVGFYLHDKLDMHKLTFLRAGIRYHIKPVFLHIAVNSCGFTAEFLELGIGCNINVKSYK